MVKGTSMLGVNDQGFNDRFFFLSSCKNFFEYNITSGSIVANKSFSEKGNNGVHPLGNPFSLKQGIKTHIYAKCGLYQAWFPIKKQKNETVLIVKRVAKKA